MPYKNKNSPIAIEKQRKRSKKHYLENKDDIDYIKRRRTASWKHAGIKGDYEEIFHQYITQEKCYDCNVTFSKKPKGKDCRVTDHHHSSGHFRHIICQGCNTSRGKIDRLKSSVLLELHRYFIRN